MKLKRPLYGPGHPDGPSRGRDVQGFVKRTLHRMGKRGIIEPFPKPERGFNPVYNEKTENAIEQIRRIQKRKPYRGPFRQDDLDALWKHANRYSRWIYRVWKAPPLLTKEDITFNRMLASMEEMSTHTPGYLLGGGHGVPLSSVSPYQKLDCSSSTSKALYDAGMFPHSVAWVSGQYAASYGSPGKGKYFTIYANSEHVFVRLHRSRWWRFDTSPHGDGGRGPKLRMLPRFTSSFAVRHYPGM